MPDPKPGARYCTECGSYQIVERTKYTDGGKMGSIVQHCNACRRDLTIFSGTAAQVRTFKRNRRMNQRRFGGLYS